MVVLGLVIGFPLLGFLVLLAFGKRMGDPGAGWFGTIAVASSFVAAIATWIVLLTKHGSHRTQVLHLFSWFHAGAFQVNFAFRADPLSVVMILFVTGVSAVIHLYSIGYMKRDARFHQFFVYLNLFVFSMLVLVTANNLPLTFLGWEGVGACSYWLISFWFERPSAASAGKKAFIINRIGDMGFMLGTFLVFLNFHSVSYSTVLPEAHRLPTGTAEAIALLFFLAAAGKSAQLPLFTWLLDAMEGPTPVSALIHAATMVTAGVYLMARLAPILSLAHAASFTIAIIGAITAFVAAMGATAQTDIKKIVAFSTVSQLGYMMLGIGTGAYVAAIFLMVTHAFYKALIFLSSGSVIHSLDNEQSIRRMGALAKLMPITAWTMIVAWLSIAGVPPFSGFFSKGSIIEDAYGRNEVLWVIGVVTALLTAYYMGRLVFVVFYGKARWQEVTHGHEPHESPRVMTIPLIVLAVAAAVAGLLNLPYSGLRFLHDWLSPVFGSALVNYPLSTSEKVLLPVTDTVFALLGIFLAWRLWRSHSERKAFEPTVLFKGWYVDTFYDRTFARGGTALAKLGDRVVDPTIIDGAVGGVAWIFRWIGGLGRKVQSGLVRSYLLIMIAGIVVILTYVLVSAAR